MGSVLQDFQRSMKRKYKHLTQPDVSPGLPAGAIPNAAAQAQGFTGRGPQSEPAGTLQDGSVVHGGEMVLPAGQVQAAGGPAAVENTLNKQSALRTQIPRGFQSGTGTGEGDLLTDGIELTNPLITPDTINSGSLTSDFSSSTTGGENNASSDESFSRSSQIASPTSFAPKLAKPGNIITDIVKDPIGTTTKAVTDPIGTGLDIVDTVADTATDPVSLVSPGAATITNTVSDLTGQGGSSYGPRVELADENGNTGEFYGMAGYRNNVFSQEAAEADAAGTVNEHLGSRSEPADEHGNTGDLFGMAGYRNNVYSSRAAREDATGKVDDHLPDPTFEPGDEHFGSDPAEGDPITTEPPPAPIEFEKTLTDEDKPVPVNKVDEIDEPTDAEIDRILNSDDFKKFSGLLADQIAELRRIASGQGTASKVKASSARRELALKMAAQGQLNRNRAAQMGMTGGEFNAVMTRAQFNQDMNQAGMEGRMAVAATEAAEQATRDIITAAETGRNLASMRGQYEASLRQSWTKLGLTAQEINAGIEKFNVEALADFNEAMVLQEKYGSEVAALNFKNSTGFIMGIASQLKDNPSAYKQWMNDNGFDIDMDDAIYMQNQNIVNSVITDIIFEIQNFSPDDTFIDSVGNFTESSLNSDLYTRMVDLWNFNHENSQLTKNEAYQDDGFKKWANDTFVMQRAKTTHARAILESFGSENIEAMILQATDVDGEFLWDDIEDFNFGGKTGIEAAILALANVHVGGGITHDEDGNPIPDFKHMGNQLLGIRSRPLNPEEKSVVAETVSDVIDLNEHISQSFREQIMEIFNKSIDGEITTNEMDLFVKTIKDWKPGNPLPRIGSPPTIPTTPTTGGGDTGGTGSPTQPINLTDDFQEFRQDTLKGTGNTSGLRLRRP